MKTVVYLFSFLALTLSPQVFALPSDAEQPIHIESDKAERQGSTGKTIYIGSVVLIQGSLKLTADKLTILSNEQNEATQLIAEGKPAHLQQQPEANDPITHAKGSTIKYFIDKEVIELLENASLQQNDSTVASEHIEYHMADRTVKAGISQNNTSSRVQVVLPPKSKSTNK